MSDDYSRRVNKRMQEERRELDTPQARYQSQLDRWWQGQRALEFEQDDFYEVGGFIERFSTSTSFHKSKRDSDWRLR